VRARNIRTLREAEPSARIDRPSGTHQITTLRDAAAAPTLTEALMTILSQLLSSRTLLSLNQTQLDSIYGLLEAEVLKNEQFMKSFRTKLEREVLPGMTKSPGRSTKQT
jgi:hypothetical protein